MNIKNNPIHLRKIPRYLALTLLTSGASLILGFLSFGGMFALWPVLPLAFAAFGLSVAYEGEIYLQNIKGALKKLFSRNYLKNALAKDFLLKNFPESTDDENCPEFFRDYEKQLRLLEVYSHKKLSAESTKEQRQIEKTLREMEKWFALQLFPDANEQEESSAYTQQLRYWLAQNEKNQAQWQHRLDSRRQSFRAAALFSTLSASFMGLGTTYLIVEAFSAIPVMATIPFAFWPFMIVPMALIAGSAYGFLTYNTVTDLISHNTVKKWYQKIRQDLQHGLSVRAIFMAGMAGILAGLAIALTICTAGTWWTVATHARPLFSWMGKMPHWIMGVVNPVITGLSSVFFNIQNTAESLEMLDEATHAHTNFLQKAYHGIKHALKHVYATENWLQMINPFRLLLKLTVTPLRVLLFLGHLVSIAMTADRMPGVPQIVSALIAIISEGFEDVHYFVGHDHGHTHHHHHGHGHDHHEKAKHQPSTPELLQERLGSTAGHNHDMDIPTKILKTLTLPLYALAAGWDYLASRLNSNPDSNAKSLSFQQAWNKQRGNEKEKDIKMPHDLQHPSIAWRVVHTLALLKKYERKHLDQAHINPGLIKEKKQAIQLLSQNIREASPEQLPEILTQAQNHPNFNKHRLFGNSDKPTATQTFIVELPEIVRAYR